MTGSRRGSTEHQSSMRAVLAARDRDRELVVAVAVEAQHGELVNVSNTSWLAKPSRSSACGRSSLRNEPVAEKFLRKHDLRRVVGAVLGVAVAGALLVDPPRRGLVADAPYVREPLTLRGSRYGCSQSGSSMMWESASCMGRAHTAGRDDRPRAGRVTTGPTGPAAPRCRRRAGSGHPRSAGAAGCRAPPARRPPRSSRSGAAARAPGEVGPDGAAVNPAPRGTVGRPFR